MNIMSQTPFFSVIIPAYNAEHYLKECIDSVLKQTFKNFELIVINDGSTDSTELICQNYKVLSTQFQYYSQENQGQLIARMEGLKIAIGKYVLWLDSDDYWDSKLLETMYKYILCYQSDLIIFRYNIVNENGNFKEINPCAHSILYHYGSNKEFIQEIIKGFSGVIFCKCMKRVIAEAVDVKKIKDIKYGEDILHSLYVAKKCNKIISVPEALYYNRLNTFSVCQTPTLKQIYDSTSASDAICEFLKKENFAVDLLGMQVTHWWMNVLGLTTKNLNKNHMQLSNVLIKIRDSKSTVILNDLLWHTKLPLLKKIAFLIFKNKKMGLFIMRLAIYHNKSSKKIIKI